MPMTAWVSYARNLSKLEAAEQLALLQIFHTSKPSRYASRLRGQLGTVGSAHRRDVDAQVARMARDPILRKAIRFDQPQKKRSK